MSKRTATPNTYSATDAIVLEAVEEELDIVAEYGAPTYKIVTGTAGTLAINLVDGYAILPSIANGHCWDVQATDIFPEGTTATNLVLLWNRVK